MIELGSWAGMKYAWNIKPQAIYINILENIKMTNVHCPKCDQILTGHLIECSMEGYTEIS